MICKLPHSKYLVSIVHIPMEREKKRRITFQIDLLNLECIDWFDVFKLKFIIAFVYCFSTMHFHSFAFVPLIDTWADTNILHKYRKLGWLWTLFKFDKLYFFTIVRYASSFSRKTWVTIFTLKKLWYIRSKNVSETFKTQKIGVPKSPLEVGRLWHLITVLLSSSV